MVSPLDALRALEREANIAPQHEPASFRTSEPPMLGGSEESGIKVIPSKDVPPPEQGESQGLLDPVVPDRPSVVVVSGETSAGKTVLAYNIVYHLAEGTEFAGMKPPRPMRTLYFDLESPESVHRYLVDTIGRSDNLAFVRGLPSSLDTERGGQEFVSACRDQGADVVVLDPLSIAWPVRHEDDNAEADRQMWRLKQMAVSLNCVILALWNMGEGNPKEKFKARGATARIDRSDLALNYTELTETTRQLKIVKSRYGTRGLSLTLRFAGDMGFDAVDVAGAQSPGALRHLQHRIIELALAGKRKRKEFIDILGNEDLVDKAFSRLVQAGDLRRVKRGEYEPTVSSEPPDIRDSDSEETLA